MILLVIKKWAMPIKQILSWFWILNYLKIKRDFMQLERVFLSDKSVLCML